MTRAHQPRRAGYKDVKLALWLFVAGLVALCLAVYIPAEQLLRDTSVSALVSGGVTISAQAVAMSTGLLFFAATTTTLGLILLVLRL